MAKLIHKSSSSRNWSHT